MKYLLGLLAIMALLWPEWAWADDGDYVRSYTQGDYSVQEYILCDGASGGATRTCADFNLNQQGRGIPDYIVVHAIAFTACAGAAQIMPTGKDVTGGAESDLLSAGMTDAGTDQAVIQPVPNPIIAADTSVATNCTDLQANIKLFFLEN